MATNANTTNFAQWNTAKYNHAVAQRAWDAIEHDDDCTARQQAALNLEDCRRTLFTVPAPDIAALIDKLTIWWGKSLFNENELSVLRRKVIGDLRRIELEAVGTDEADASGRSPKKAAADVKAWQSKLAEYLEWERLVSEGPSPRWGGRDEASIVDAMLTAAAELLDVPAPSLGGVTKKLDLLWKDDRLEHIWNGAMYVLLMRDLNRLSRSQAALGHSATAGIFGEVT